MLRKEKLMLFDMKPSGDSENKFQKDNHLMITSKIKNVDNFSDLALILSNASSEIASNEPNINGTKSLLFKANQIAEDEYESEMKPRLIDSPKFKDDDKFQNEKLNSTQTLQNNETINITHTLSLQSKTASEDFGLNNNKMTFTFLDENRRSLLFTVKDPNEMVEKVFWMNNIIILDQEIAHGKKLIVEDEEGDLLSKDVLMIDASGLMTSLRKMRDGYTFFGTSEIYKNCLINDYIINYPKDLCKTRLFVLFYDRALQKYFFRTLNDSENSSKNFIYVKLGCSNFPVKKKQYILIGPTVIRLHSHPFDENDNTVLQVDVFLNGDKNDKTEYLFHKTQTPIIIGRKSSCTIPIESSLLSKIHCCVTFNASIDCWELSDGYHGKPSTNGTWLLLNTRYEISEEKTRIKIASSVIRITMY